MDIDQIRLITQYASKAPSVHNTQPWRFVAREHALDVRADTARTLRYLDPAARQLHISCGAAIEYARLGARSLGLACTVRLTPKADDPTLLATLTVGQREAALPEEKLLIAAIPQRYTDRGPYDERPVPADLLRRLHETVGDRGCWVRVLDRPGDRPAITMLLDDAERAEVGDPAYRAELAAWRRDAAAADGLPATAYAAWEEQDTVPDVPLRDFTASAVPRRPGGTGEPPRVRRDTLVLLGSDTDTPRGWLQTGRALGLMLLTLTAAGLSSQPLGPVTDLPTSRLRLRRELGLLGHPQLLLRVGYGHRRPQTGRREVDEVLSVAPVA